MSKRPIKSEERQLLRRLVARMPEPLSCLGEDAKMARILVNRGLAIEAPAQPMRFASFFPTLAGLEDLYRSERVSPYDSVRIYTRFFKVQDRLNHVLTHCSTRVMHIECTAEHPWNMLVTAAAIQNDDVAWYAKRRSHARGILGDLRHWLEAELEQADKGDMCAYRFDLLERSLAKDLPALDP